MHHTQNLCEKILKSAREKKHVTYRETIMQIKAYFSSEILEARNNEMTCLKCRKI